MQVDSIRLDQWLSGNAKAGPKILITDQPGNGNRLIRKYNRQAESNVTSEVSAKSLNMIAAELIQAWKVWKDLKGGNRNRSFAQDGTQLSVLRLDRILREKIEARQISFLKEDSLCFETAQEVLKLVNELRSHMVAIDSIEALPEKEEAEKRTKTKLRELMQLKEAYEADLEITDSFDQIRLLKMGAELLKQPQEGDASSLQTTTVPIAFLLPWISDSQLGVLQNYRMTPLERDFLDVLASHAGMSWTVLTFLPESFEASDKKNMGQQDRMHFFQAYGMVNEVREVIRRIQENEAIHYGDTAIYYTASEYENILCSELDKERIPYCMTEERHGASSAVIQQILSLLKFAQDDFSYEELGNVVMNPIMALPVSSKEETAEKAIRAYQDILRVNLMWGIDRYRNYLKNPGIYQKNLKIEAEKSQAAALQSTDIQSTDIQNTDTQNADVRKNYLDQYPRFKEFLDQLVNMLFLDGMESRMEKQDGTASYFFDRLLKFVKTYSVNSKENNLVLSTLWQKRAEYIAAEDNWISKHKAALDQGEKVWFHELYQVYEELFQKHTYKEPSSNTGISLIRLNNCEVLDRRYHYFIGLAASLFNVRTTDSPVLSDEEIKLVILPLDKRTGVKDSCMAGPLLAEDRNRIRREAFDQTISTADDTMQLTLSCPYFDTVNQRAYASAVTFLEYLDRNKLESIRKYHLPLDPDKVSHIPDFQDNALPVINSLQDNVVSKQENASQDGDKTEEKEKLVDPVNAENQKSDTSSQTDHTSPSVSSSTIQTILNCPLSYYYEKVRNVPKAEHQVRQAYRWLDPARRGNLFHYVLKDYCDYLMEYYQKKQLVWNTEPTEEDQKKLEEIMDEKLTQMKVEMPAASDVVMNREINDAKKDIQLYVEWFHKNRLTDPAYPGLKFIGNELEFDEVTHRMTRRCEDQTDENMSLKYHGVIDRLMGRMDSETEGLLWLHLTDYKTGSKKSLTKKVSRGTQIQHLTYALAARDYCKKKQDELEKIFGSRITKIGFERVDYEFPYEHGAGNDYSEFVSKNQIMEAVRVVRKALFDQSDSVSFQWITELAVSKQDEKGNKIKGKDPKQEKEYVYLPIASEKNLWAVFHGDKKDMMNRIEKVMSDMEEEDNWRDNHCAYCTYQSICRKWIGYRKQEW